MAYTTNIPPSTQLLSQSQPLIQGNFATIDTGMNGGAGNVGFSREHLTMTDATNGGLHQQVTFYTTTTQPAQTGLQSVLYTKSVGSPAVPALFFKNSVADYPLVQSPQIFMTQIKSTNGSGSFTPATFSMKYSVVGGVTFFYASQSVASSGVTGGFWQFTLPTVPLNGGNAVFDNTNVPITASSTVTTTSNAGNVTVTYTFSGFYI